MLANIEPASGRELHIARIIDAPRALLFRLWTDPQHVARWWGPQGFITIHCDMDIREGGAFRFGMRSPRGSEHWKVGVYREIVAPERIVFTFSWENPDGTTGHELLTTVTFAEHGAKTKLTLRQAVFETMQQCDDHRAGWTSCLERFAEYATTN